MPALHPPAPFPLPEISMESSLIRFYKDGACTSPKTRDARLSRIADKDQPIILFSHGWNNDVADAFTSIADF